jgi:hypothetical protein
MLPLRTVGCLHKATAGIATPSSEAGSKPQLHCLAVTCILGHSLLIAPRTACPAAAAALVVLLLLELLQQKLCTHLQLQ